MAGSSAGDPVLLQAISAEVRERGPISFARFMEVALYHDTRGYYARGSAGLGRSGDFFTASDVGPAFGGTLARQIAEIDDLLGRPAPFHYVEFAAGRGLLARDVLEAIADRDASRRRRWTATLVEASAGMRAEAARSVPSATVVGPDAPLPGGDGCVVAVEMFDALPVHRVIRRGGALHEVLVGLDGGQLVPVERMAAPEVDRWAAAYGAAPRDGDQAEVCLALGPTLRALASAVGRGVIIVIDYGDDAVRLYGPGRRRGTLLAYHRHRTNEDYLHRVGEQDLTAHVNFTALTREAVSAGLVALGTTTQDRFLVANGILDGLDADGRDGLADVKRRLQAKQLIHPDGMGRAFKVAVFAKGLAASARLSGLADVFGS